ncbi:MAG: hypothetical protein JWP44_3641 [Mucilaginibacter sp.]|nr:hypothetical protein [Mucilaginibacter sp.]
MPDSRSVLTLATGKPIFVEMAINLARSFFWWHPDSDINFQLVTDQEDQLPEDLKDKVQIIKVKPGEFGKAFSPKLHLDKLITSDRTLFVDSDCLLFGKLDNVFEQFRGHSVSVIGSYIENGEWFGDIEKVCKTYNVPHIPKFNGGIYYLEKGEAARSVYATARELEERYDEIGFVRLRNSPNDEVLMALAMQLHKQTPIKDDGSIMSDPQACPGGYHIDVISGKSWLYNPPAPHKLHQEWYPFERVSPLVFHFLGYYTAHYPYKRETYRLYKAITGSSMKLTNFIALITIELPARIKNTAKNILRPVYHLLFGIRKVKPSRRI